MQLLCNNAGVGATKMSWEHTKSDWDWVLGVNMWSIIHANRFFIPRMLKQVLHRQLILSVHSALMQDVRSRILNTASAAGLISTPGSVYDIKFDKALTVICYYDIRDDRL